MMSLNAQFCPHRFRKHAGLPTIAGLPQMRVVYIITIDDYVIIDWLRSSLLEMLI
jgi:hypothetical protein